MKVETLSHNINATVVKGELTPLPGRVLVRDLDFSERVTKGGIYIPGDDGMERGVHPRWAQVWKLGKGEYDIEVGDWVLLKHGRWSRTIMVEENGEKFRVNLIDYPDAVLVVGDRKTDDIYVDAAKSYT